MSAPAPTTAGVEQTYVAPSFRSLLRAEVLRVRSRRFVAWSAVVLLLLMALVAVVYFANTASYSQAEIDRAVAVCTEAGAAGIGDPSDVLRADGSSCDVRDAAVAGTFPGDSPAYRFEIAEWALLVGIAAAAFGFILGATFGGADWAQKTMPALLFWEPRRTRVFAAKLLALFIGTTAFYLTAQVVWALMSAPTLMEHGVWDDGTGPLLEAVLSNLGRTWLLALVFAAVGYGIASLTRNTGAALGAGFVYFAVFESFVGFVFSRAQEWLLLINIGALLTPGGIDDGGSFQISPERAALVLIGYALVVNAVAYTLFRRRDIT